MAEPEIRSSAHLLAEVLSGSWRASPPPLECSAAELQAVAPLLLQSGAAALAWARVRRSNLQTTSAAEKLQETYRLYRLQTRLQEKTIEEVVSLLRSARIEPILVKGWVVAQLYPERGLRPCGDIDLCVRPEEFVAAEATLANLKRGRYQIDLHSGFDKFGGGAVEEFFARSQLVKLGVTEVRILSLEDHLRVLCVHLLREGAWRPLWLCDVAAVMESRAADFDWSCCLTENRRLRNWVICAIRLAQQLLGADVRDTPADEIAKPLPHWLIPTILKEWQSPLPSMRQRHIRPMAKHLRYPSGILNGLRNRWPNPIEATIALKREFSRSPRFPLQLGSYLARSAKFAMHLPGLIREE